MPVLNERKGIRKQLDYLENILSSDDELIIVDGGSQDGTAAFLNERESHGHFQLYLTDKGGRAAQMNLGAEQALGDVILFLHADTQIPESYHRLIGAIPEKKAWGRFDIRLNNPNPALSVVAFLINIRSRLSGIATGDQAIFVKRETFIDCGGYPALPLMEDIELSRQLKRAGRPYCVVVPAVTSARRWESKGIFKTILLMWRLRALYFFGVSAERLAEVYRR